MNKYGNLWYLVDNAAVEVGTYQNDVVQFNRIGSRTGRGYNHNIGRHLPEQWWPEENVKRRGAP